MGSGSLAFASEPLLFIPSGIQVFGSKPWFCMKKTIRFGVAPLVGDATTRSGASEAPNAAPVLAAIGNQPVNEGVTLNVPLSATDADGGDTLTFTTSTLESFCSLTDGTGPAGNLQCTPGFTDDGTYSVTVTVTDNGTGTLTDFETFDIIVGDDNRAPVLA